MTVVLLHAFPVDETMWAPQTETLAPFEAVAPRLYGRGRTVDEWAESVLGEVEGEIAAVGASMGGYVALAMARLAPERVRGVLLAASRAGDDSPARRSQRDDAIAVLRNEGVDAWLASFGNPAPGHLPIERSAEKLAAALEVLRDRPDSHDVVRSFPGPFFIAVGDRDDLMPVDEARDTVALAQNGRLEVLSGAGHFLTVEQPEEFNGVLLDFLTAVGERRA